MNYEWGPEKYGIRRVINEMPDCTIREASVDFEYDDDVFVGVGLYAGGSAVYYFTQLSSELVKLLTSIRVFGHYFKSDVRQARKWGVHIPMENVCADTFIESYVKDAAAESHGLKFLCKEHLDIEWPEFGELVPKQGNKKGKFSDLPLDVQSSYNGMDCIGTYKLRMFHQNYLSAYEKLYTMTYELPLMRLLFEMECKGVKIDVPYLEPLARELEAEVIMRRQKVYDAFGFEFNPNSAPQKVQSLNLVGIKVKGSNKKFDLDPHKLKPPVAALMEYTKVQKISSTYSTKLAKLALLDPSHRIHGEFNQDTNTGRLSSKGPNLQNIPARGELGKKIRKAFVVEDGHVWLSADYSQIDLRCLAHESNEPTWVRAFTTDGGDPHQATADAANKFSARKVERQTAKTVNFAESYGSGPSNIAYELQCSLKEAKEFQEAIRNGLSTFVGWRNNNHRAAARNRGVSTLFGRWIALPGIRAVDFGIRGYFERRADCIKGQASAGEIVKAAMLQVRKELGLIPTSQVHDELNFELKKNEAKEAGREIKRIMETVVKLRVPLEAKVAIGPNWAEAKP